MVCSFNADEPVREILESAALVPDVAFLVTGDVFGRDVAIPSPPPANVTFTGFLSTAEYGQLLQTASVVMSLTTRDHTMLRGAYEAIYQGTPVIVSDWPILRAAFDEGAAHVRNDAEGIVEGIRTMQRQHAAYRAGAERLRRRKLDAWHHTKRAIVERITPSPA